MPPMSWISVWAAALVLATLAPWCVQAFIRVHQERARRRTMDALAKARAAEGTRAPSSSRKVEADAEG
jgi:hypothetical protein